jgi:DNA-binding MarR family transcriptional regulator
MSNISKVKKNKIELTPALKFILDLSRVQAVLSRKLDNIGNGLGFMDFVILYHLNQADNNKLRRIDLADKVGLTASGVTRLLLPMEKIGLVGRESNPRDARVSFVTLAPGGKQLLDYSIEQAEYFAETVVPSEDKKEIREITNFLEEVGRRTF